MIQIKIVTNAKRTTIAIDENITVRAFLDNNAINYTNAPVYIDGSPLEIGDHDKSFAELGIAANTQCNLSSVVKTENA